MQPLDVSVFAPMLSSMRYNQPEITHASWPKKKDKLPAGASYTCLPGQKALVGLPVDIRKEMEEMALALEGRSPVFTPQSSEGEEMISETKTIIHRLGRKSKKAKIWRGGDDQESVTSTITSDSDFEDSTPKKRKTNSVRKNWVDELNGSWDSEEEDKAGVIYRTKNIFFLSFPSRYEVRRPFLLLSHFPLFLFTLFRFFHQNHIGRYFTSLEHKDKEQDDEEEEAATDNPQDVYEYPTGSYVAAIYQGEWFVGPVLDKTNELKALPADDYIFINLMQRVSKDKDLFKWPDKADKLNTLREDVLF
jgi:hypothetical protein